MIHWNTLASATEVNDLVEQSRHQPCLIFKHSTSCPISGFAKSRLEKNWNLPEGDIQPFYLDLLSYRAVSGFIAEQFGVEHESPQILLIKDGVCIYHTSHLDISVDHIEARLKAA